MKCCLQHKTNVLFYIIFQIIELRFFPEFESLLADHDPLPAYCLKLLHACTEKSHGLLRLMLSRSITLPPMIFDILQTRQGDINSSVFQSSIGILNNILSDKQFDLIGLSNAGLFDILTSAFVDVASAIEDDAANVVSYLLLQLLDTLNHVLKNIETVVKVVLGKQQLQQSHMTKENVEVLLKKAKVLSELNGILLNFLVYDDVDVQEWSCRCLYLCAELFGGAESEDCFTKANLDCMCIAIKTSPRKRQKLLLRITKRFATSSTKFKDIFIAPSLSFSEVIAELCAIECNDNDSKSIRNISTELMKFFKK